MNGRHLSGDSSLVNGLTKWKPCKAFLGDTEEHVNVTSAKTIAGDGATTTTDDGKSGINIVARYYFQGSVPSQSHDF